MTIAIILGVTIVVLSTTIVAIAFYHGVTSDPMDTYRGLQDEE